MPRVKKEYSSGEEAPPKGQHPGQQHRSHPPQGPPQQPPPHPPQQPQSARGSRATSPHDDKDKDREKDARSREGSEGPDAQPTEKISCVECRRLKRKCDRIYPCNQCRRYDKTCVFPQPEAPRRGKKYLAEVRGRVEHLERLLAKHAPHVPLDQADDSSPDDSHASHLSHSHSSHAPPPPHDPLGPPHMIPPLISPPFPHPPYPTPPVSDERGRMPGPGSSSVGMGADYIPGMQAQRSIPTPVLAPSLSPDSSIGQFDHAPSSSSRIASAMHPPSRSQSSNSSIRTPSRSQSQSQAQRTPGQGPTADEYERLAGTANGYEWNERRRLAEQDGTGSLSVRPDGDGYLGFASGAALLHILQMKARNVKLDTYPTMVEQAGPPGWQPSHEEKRIFMEAYFDHYHKQYPIVHQHLFEAQVAEVFPQPPEFQWRVLYNVVLGIGAFCASQPMYMIDYFLDRATCGITVDHLETGSLVLVQAYTLLSNLAQKRNKLNAGSTYLGIAVRMAIGLGLHKELPIWKISPFEREVRRRVWWVLFIFDSGASITFGRPILLPKEESDVRVVHNVLDRDFTPLSTEVPTASRDMTVYSALIWQTHFCQTSNHMYNRIISSPNAPTMEELLQMDAEIQDWYKTLPKWMSADTTPQVCREAPWIYFAAHKLHWRYNNLRFLIGRRVFVERCLRGQSFSPTAQDNNSEEFALLDICFSCALDTIYDIHKFFKGRVLNRLECWYGLHFLFQATYVPLLALHSDPNSISAPAWREAVEMASDAMKYVIVDPLAERGLRHIEALMPPAPDAVNAMNTLPLINWDSFLPCVQDQAHTLADADIGTLAAFMPFIFDERQGFGAA